MKKILVALTTLLFTVSALGQRQVEVADTPQGWQLTVDGTPFFISGMNWELKNGLPRKESQFGAIYWWMVKMGQSLALVLSGAVLKWVAFDQNIAVQAPETLTQLRLADIIIPAGSAFVAIFVMLGYNLTETKMKEIKAQLKKRYEKE